ncbi:MAG: type II CAAX prenyl endopeptidase Rce1 family protein [Promethearchaeota archaeon]
MNRRKLKYYSLAKYPTYEILMEGQIASAGAHQARLIEKYKKNKNYIKHQILALKIVFAFLFAFLPILPLVTYLQLANSLESYTVNSITFISSFMFSIYFGITFLYMLMFGMVTVSSFMSGNSFKWLQTLPFSKKDIKKIGFMTLFRDLDIPLIISAVGFPLIMLIGTQNFLIFAASFLVSFLNIIFNFSLLVIIGEKLSFLFSESKGKSKKVNIVRMLTMFGYFSIAFGSGMIFSLGFSSVDRFLIIFTIKEPSTGLGMMLSLIPIIVAPAYFLTISSIPNQVPLELLLSTLIGFALFIIIVWAVFKVAQQSLRTTISTEIIVDSIKKKDIEVDIKKKSKITAYIWKDLVSTTRDMQSFMFLFFPIFYPLIMVFSVQGPIINEVTTIEGILILWSIIIGIYLFIPPMLIVGFLNLEESGSSIKASLPVIPRDQAKAKIILMSSIQGISLAFISIFLTILTNSILVLILFVVTLPIAWSLLLVMFEMKIHFFGKMKYKYILEELNKEYKIFKWILMILIEFGIYFAILTVGGLLILSFDIFIAILVLSIVGITGFSILIFTFTRMFPKIEKMAEFKTGGFLREHINIGTLVLLVLYFIWGFLVYPIVFLIFLFLPELSFTEAIFIEFFLNFGFAALLWLVAVPLGLKLPKKESFSEFTQTIGLGRHKNTRRIIIFVFGLVVINYLSLLLLTFILGELRFDHWYLDNPNRYLPFPYYFGWFIFIYMLMPGIWEEIAFRGVILNLQLKKYSNTTAVILNGVIFGLFHLINLIGGFELYGVLLQVIFASCFGIALAYLRINSRSLIPCILIHYLFNSFNQIFTACVFPNILSESLFILLGIGVIPMIITILLVKILFKMSRNTDIINQTIPSNSTVLIKQGKINDSTGNP